MCYNVSIMNDSSDKFLWKILVPTIRNDGRPIRTRFHKVWDKKVRELTNGLTINPPTTAGYWVNPEGKLYRERMIPVEIFCSEKEIGDIAEMSKKYYEQEKMFVCKISDKVMFV